MDSDAEDEADDMDADQHPDVRNTQRRADQRISRDDEFDESEDEEMDEANGIRRQPGAMRQRNISIMDYKNPHADADIDLDEEGEPVLVSRTNGDALAGTGSREENRRIAEEKADAALSPKSNSSRNSSVLGSPSITQPRALNGQTPISRESSQGVAPLAADEGVDEAEEDDMEMDMDIDNSDEGDDESEGDRSAPQAFPTTSLEQPITLYSSPSAKEERSPPQSPVPRPQSVVNTKEDVEMADQPAAMEVEEPKEQAKEDEAAAVSGGSTEEAKME